MRLSIGANRRQLVGQLLVESLVLAIVGAAVGLLASRWTLDAIAAQLPRTPRAPSTSYRSHRHHVRRCARAGDGRPLWFVPGAAQHAAKSGHRFARRGTEGRGSRRVAIPPDAGDGANRAVDGTSGCRRVVRSQPGQRHRVDVGINTENLITFAISPELNGYTPERSRALFERVEDELMALPGVTSVTASLVPLLSGSNWGSSVSVQGFQAGPDTDTHSNYNEIGPDYFRTIGVPLLGGREFTRADTLPRGKVAIVNESFAKKFNLGRDAVGKCISDSVGNDVKLDTADCRARQGCQIQRGQSRGAAAVLSPVSSESASRLHRLLRADRARPNS